MGHLLPYLNSLPWCRGLGAWGGRGGGGALGVDVEKIPLTLLAGGAFALFAFAGAGTRAGSTCKENGRYKNGSRRLERGHGC